MKDNHRTLTVEPSTPDGVGTENERPKSKTKKDKNKKNKKDGEPRTKIRNKVYERELAQLQLELAKLQEWIRHEGLRVVVVFEGRDTAGKGGAIKRIAERLNPRVVRVVALPAPTKRERSQWYFQRYVVHLPAAGEMVLFDRSWYNRAGVERVMGYCTEEEYQEFLRGCPEFEQMLIRDGIILIKYWFSVSEEEQERRFQERMDDPVKRWKLSPMDLEARAKWIEYSRAKDDMFAHTDIPQAPWYVVNAEVQKHSRLNCIAHLLQQIPYDDLTKIPKTELPPRPKIKAKSKTKAKGKTKAGYVRTPFEQQTIVPEVYGPDSD